MIRMFQTIAICTILIGCESKPKPLDPLGSFTKLVEASVSNAKQGAVAKTVSDEWAKYTYKTNEPVFDVKKTDSLRSPYSATLSIITTEVISDIFPIESQAQAAPVSKVRTTMSYKFRYAFQNEKWLLTGWSELDGDYLQVGWIDVEYEESERKKYGMPVTFFAPLKSK